ncbi:rhomboid family intramembrane serine protease [Candidatus Poribacteria bacterium]|nr:rhomboid family intramembrane serine protease [Candidatus Poribacteria bacterium]
MKIQIRNQIFDIDETTLYDWIKLGRVPPEAFVWSETLTDGQWQPVSEFPPVQKLWDLESDSERTNTDQSENSSNELKTGQGFLKYPRRLPVVTLILIVLNVAIFHPLELRLIASPQDLGPLIQFGAYSYHLIVEDGEYWRLLTSTFLHAHALHLLLNMGILFLLGSLLEGVYGRSRFLFFYLISAIISSVASLPFVQNALGVGASGAVFGLIGVAVALGIRYKDRLPRRLGRILGLRLLPFIAIDILLGFFIFPYFNYNVNNAAHLGGLFTGFVGGMVLTPEIFSYRRSEKRIVAGLTAVLVALTIASGVMPVLHAVTDSKDTAERQVDRVSPADLTDYIKSHEKIILTRPYDPNAYAILENLYIEALQTFPDDASWTHKLKQFYEKALQADPDNPVWNNNLLWVYHATAFERPDEQTDLTDYIELCETVANKRGYNQPLYHNLEYFYTRAKGLAPQEGKFWDRKLEVFYQVAIKKDPENGTWNNNLAWLYVEQQSNPQKTVELALNAVKQAPTEKNFLDTLGWAYYRNGQYRKALRAFEQVVASAIETEEEFKAQESGWKGITKLVQTEKSPQASRNFTPVFLKFYERLSRLFPENSANRTKLDAVFKLYQQGTYRR